MWHEYEGSQPCVESLCADITDRVRARLDAEGACTLAVSGGRSPIPVFERLASSDLDWSRVRIRLVDERYVPPSHADSNEGLVRRHLLQGKAAAADFVGLYREGATPGQAAQAAAADTGRIHLALLGMGDDGHTASLFPGAAQLETALAPDAAQYLHITPPEAPHERITLSLAALLACDHLFMHISGTHKRDILLQAQDNIDKRLPVSFVAAQSGVPFDVHWHP